MSTEYCRKMLRIVVAQICQHLGWHSANSTPLEVLTDVTERYILDVSKLTHQYAEQYGRTKVNLNDLGLAFRTMDISVSELEDYIKHVDAFPFGKELIAFPKPKKNKLGFPNSKSREIYHREEHVPHYLPYMFPGMEDEVEAEEEISPPPSDATASQAANLTPATTPNAQETKSNENLSETSPNIRAGEKRPLSSPSEGQIYKRQRLTNNNLPEEAGHSQYEMTTVKMLPSGLLSPLKNEGRLPEASFPRIFTPIEKKKEPVVKEVPKKIVPGLTSDGSKLEDKENITVKKSNQKEPGKVNPAKTLTKPTNNKAGSNILPNKRGKKKAITKGKITKITKKTSANKTVVVTKTIKGKVVSKNSTKNSSNKNSVKNLSEKSSSKTDPSAPGSPGSRLKELLLHPKAEKTKTTKVDKKGSYSASSSAKAGTPTVKGSSNLLIPGGTAMAMTKNLHHSIADDDSSTDESPEPRLIIAESYPRQKEKGDPKWGKSAKHDNVHGPGKKGEQSVLEKGKTGTGPKEKKTPTQKKKKEPVKRSTSESIDACINTVVRNCSAAVNRERKQKELDALPKSEADALVAAATAAVVSAAAAATAASSAALNSTAPSNPCPKPENLELNKKGERKTPKKKNVTKEKVKKIKTKTVEQNNKENASTPVKVKEKAQPVIQHQNSPGPDRTPLACSERFASDAWKIYDFDSSPPIARCCSSPTQGTSSLNISPSSKQMSPTAMDSLTLLSTAATSAANAALPLPSDLSNLSMQDPDHLQLKMKIGLKKGGKGKIKSKLKSKTKEHKKEKKDKKKDKEKKKKMKERDEKKQKDKDRIKEDNYQCSFVPQDGQVSTPLSVPRLKLNIKIGGSTPVAVAPDEGSNKSTPPPPPPVSVSITERSPSNVTRPREPPHSPSLSRPEILKLVIRTPMPPTVMTPPAVLSPPMAHPEKVEKNIKPEKPVPKAKPAPKKKTVVKKPAVKKADKKMVKKGAKAYPLEKMESFTPDMMPAEFPKPDKLDGGSKQIMYPNVAEMHHPIIKQEKQVPVKHMMKQPDRVMVPTNVDKPEMNMPVKTMFKEEIDFTRVSDVSPRTSARGRGKGAKGKANKPVVVKPEKSPVKIKSERVANKTKAALKAMTKVPVAPIDVPITPRTPVTKVPPAAKMPTMKPEKTIITKGKPIMKINRPPNRLGRPPKVEVPPSPPPTIPYPSSPSLKSHISTLPIAYPLTCPSFNPSMPSVSTHVANMPQANPIPFPTPVPKMHTSPVPKVQPTPKATPKSHLGRGGKAGRPSRAASKNLQNSRNAGVSAITSYKENMTDSIRTQSDNFLSTPLLPSPLTQEQFLKAESPVFNTAHVAANIQAPGVSAPFMMPLDAKGSKVVVEPSKGSIPLGKRTVQRSVFAETVGTFLDENGEKVWICPACTLPDDGSAMIGCDGCDEWYHWPCVNIKEPPPEKDPWFCSKCILKSKQKPKRKWKRRTY